MKSLPGLCKKRIFIGTDRTQEKKTCRISARFYYMRRGMGREVVAKSMPVCKLGRLTWAVNCAAAGMLTELATARGRTHKLYNKKRKLCLSLVDRRTKILLVVKSGSEKFPFTGDFKHEDCLTFVR